MDSGAPKDNANPVILSVDEKSRGRLIGRRRSNKKGATAADAATAEEALEHPIGWSDIVAISADIGGGGFDIDDNDHDDDRYYDTSPPIIDDSSTLDLDDNDDCTMRRPEDRAVVLALADVSASTNGQGVSLLKKVGVVVAPVPDSSSSLLSTNNIGPLSSSVPVVNMMGPTATPNGDRKKKEEVLRGNEDEGTPMEEDNNHKEKTTKTNHHRTNRDRLCKDEIYEIVRNIQDPEHPLTLEQLGVVSREQIEVHDVLDDDDDDENESADNMNTDAAPYSTIHVRFTPTVPHCSMATLIGLSLRVKLLRSVSSRFKVCVSIEPGTHQSENAVNKQLMDKERICAALENPHLCKVVNRCIGNGMKTSSS